MSDHSVSSRSSGTSDASQALPPRRFDLLGVPVDAVDLERAAARIFGWIAAGRADYVCVRDVHGLMRALDDPTLFAIHQKAGMVTPDGMPLVAIGRWKGYGEIERVCGVDLFETVCRLSQDNGARHFFFGGKPGVAERLAEALTGRFPRLRVAGCLCPPFRPPTPEEDESHVEAIRASGADIVWVGLSTPKQELWMADHVGRLPGVTLVGVGAAFDFLTGAVVRAPRWMQRSGLEWVHRFAQEPRRLWYRYLVLAPRFVGRVVSSEILGRPNARPIAPVVPNDDQRPSS